MQLQEGRLLQLPKVQKGGTPILGSLNCPTRGRHKWKPPRAGERTPWASANKISYAGLIHIFDTLDMDGLHLATEWNPAAQKGIVGLSDCFVFLAWPKEVSIKKSQR